MNENPQCQLCELHKSAHSKSVCLKGEGLDSAKLVIFLDAPNLVEDRRHRSFVGEASDLLKWMLRRMSVPLEEVYLDYVLKCYTGACKAFSKKANRQSYYESCSVYRVATLQLIRPRAVVAMGRYSCETFLGSDKVSDFEGTSWTPQEPAVRNFIQNVWITYSPAFALQDSAESVGIYRVLWAAAKQAGLNPCLDETVKPYDGYGT